MGIMNEKVNSTLARHRAPHHFGGLLVMVFVLNSAIVSHNPAQAIAGHNVNSFRHHGFSPDLEATPTTAYHRASTRSLQFLSARQAARPKCAKKLSMGIPAESSVLHACPSVR